MKNLKPLILFLFTGFAFTLHAQFSGGFRAGYINSWEEYGDVYLPPNAKTHVNGLHIAGLAYEELNKNFSIGIEPGIAQKGAACYPGSFNFFNETKFQLNYFEMPLLVAAKIPIGQKHFGVSGKAGYGASYLISAFRETQGSGSNDKPVREQEDLNDSDLLKRWDSGFYAGVGLSYKIGNSQLFLESNYYHAVADAFKVSTSKNRSIYIGLGFLVKE